MRRTSTLFRERELSVMVAAALLEGIGYMHTQFDKLVDQFEEELRAGRSPQIEQWLDRTPEISRREALEELISLEVFYRLKSGASVDRSDYARLGETALMLADNAIHKADHANTEFNSGPPQPSSEWIGQYKLLQKIGEGGMGEVWMAEQNEPVKRRVALKLIKAEVASKELVARFESERQALAMMNHQNIAKVLDAGTTDRGTPYFVMELVKGIPITQYCDQNKMSVDDRLKLFIPVCKAIQHAHHKGILHRDVKPSNVLVTHYDGDAVPKVIDFGMAKAFAQNMKLTDKTLFTEFGKVVGTLQYMSPEQAEMNALDVDTRADIYSLGVLLYELLTGSTPVDSKTLNSNAFFQVLEIIREKDPPRPSYRLSSASNDAITRVSNERKISFSKLKQVLQGDLDWVVMKALEKDRTRRYQTAADFARDISNYLEGEAVIARPPSAMYQIRKFAARNRGLVASVGAVGLALLIGIIGTGFGLVRANFKAAEAEAHRLVAEEKTREAEREREKAEASALLAVSEKDKALNNEKRAIAAEKRTSIESKRARDSEAVATFQLAMARFDANRAWEARNLLHQIPEEYRNTFEWKYCNRKFLGSDITCFGHTNSLYKVAFSPDGKWFASASRDRTIKLWDAKTGRELKTLRGHAGSVGSIAVSPSGKTLASASGDRTVRLWDFKSGQEIGKLEGHLDLVASVVFSPDGEMLATASDDKTVKLWDGLTFENTKTFSGHAAEVGNVVFSPDGNRLVSSSVDQTVRVWDSNSGKELASLNHNRSVISVAFSPDGKRFASATFDAVKLWDASSFKEVQSLKGHSQFVHHVAFSPDGTRLASGGRDKSIRLWDVKTGLEVSRLTGHSDWVNGVAFSPDGSRLASVSYDRTVKLWDTRSGQHVNTIRGHMNTGTCVAFSSDGSRFASSSADRTVKVWDAVSGSEVSVFTDHSKTVQSLDFSPTGDTIASAGYDKTIRLWDVRSGRSIATLKGHKDTVSSVQYSPDGKRIASAGVDKSVRVWDAVSGEELASFTGHQSAVYDIEFSPNGKLLASIGGDKTIRLWDVNSGQQIRTFVGHFRAGFAIAFSPDATLLASASADRTIKLWDVGTGKEVSTLRGHSEPVNCIAFIADGSRLVSASDDKSIKLWNVETKREIMSLGGHDRAVNWIAFSPDGTRVVSTGDDTEVKLWDADSGLGIETLTGHTDRVFGVSLDPKVSRVYSKSKNENLVWSIDKRKPDPGAPWDPPTEERRVSPSGRWFVTTDMNNVVLVDREYFDTSRAKGYLACKSRFDSVWHRRMAVESAEANDWFASSFHFACLLKHDPESTQWYDGLHDSHRLLAAGSGKEAQQIANSPYSIIKEALAIPRGDTTAAQ